MKKIVSLASFAATLLLVASSAFAQVPPPPVTPGNGDSPGTGENDPSPLPTPVGYQTSCHHPDSHVNNYVGDEWYDSMHGDIYYMQQHVKHFMDWSKGYHNDIYRYSYWLNYMLDEYYFKHYDNNGHARQYNYGRPTRGDFNYAYYYWIRPLYYKIISYSYDYYRVYGHKSGHESKVREYQGFIKDFVYKYHHLARCNYGFNGDDGRAADDTQFGNLENNLGF